MSWQLASFLVLGAVLIGGFAWYERSRPPAQVVALVAALAALAIAGRVAFAAFPNVKPTTDIVIFAGYALGPAPGFAVGALAGLVSNFWFGQGPWTPWQMVGWGLCGVLGAALALGTRNAGRLILAATCGFAGVAYGALLNFSLMATYGGALSLERFGVLEARAVPFDAAHAIGNVALALVAGPAMVRMLIRFRERFEWRRGEAVAPGGAGRPGLVARGGATAVLLIALALFTQPAHAASSDVGRAADWLVSAQNPDGGFGASPGDDSGAAMTGWAMLGLEAAGRNPFDVSRGGHTAVDFLRSEVGQLKSPGDLARTILALEGAGANPRDFGGHDLVGELLDSRRGNGSWEGWPGSTAYAVIALRAAGATGGLAKSLEWLVRAQSDDGGWGDVPGSPSTADGTGAVLQALSPGSKALHRGLSYLREAQRPGGGFPLGGGGSVNTQSTAWAIQGIHAAGGNPDSYKRGGASALDYLAANQAGDGHYRYSNSSNQTPTWVTGEVLVAAADKHLPLSPPARKAKPKTSSANSAAGIPVSPVTPGPGVTSTIPNTSSRQGGATGNASSSGVPSGTSPRGSAGSPTNALRNFAGATPGTNAPATQGTRVSEESGTSAAEPPASDSAPHSTGTSPAGAIFLGVAAGCLLFAAAWGARRCWMHWRYGL